jgi:hypothetical protein
VRAFDLSPCFMASMDCFIIVLVSIFISLQCEVTAQYIYAARTMAYR